MSYQEQFAVQRLRSFTQRTIAGGHEDFLHVQHLILRGSNYEIGRKLAEIALEDHLVRKAAACDPWKVRSQRRLMQKNFPMHYERMRGAAAAMNIDIDQDTFDCSYLNYAPRLPGCSTVFYPPAFTADATPILSRNFDFTTGTFMGTAPAINELPAVARPYAIEMYPDEGYPSLYLAAFDLLAGCTDGINAAGLMVALNADSESPRSFPISPTMGGAVGINEIQLPRLLLDTCATVEEAKRVLLENKHFYMCAPCHYLIADRSGKSFVWEFSSTRNEEYILDGKDRPQVLTNHLLHRYQTVDELPHEDFAASSYQRYRTLTARISGTDQPLTQDQIKAYNNAVAITDESYPAPQAVPDRTLWHSLYDAARLTLDVDFYLGDEVIRNGPVTRRIRRSGYRHLALGG